MAISLRTLRGEVLGSDLKPVPGYVVAQAVATLPNGDLADLSTIKDASTGLMLIGTQRVDFGPSLESTIRNRVISGYGGPVTIINPGTWTMDLPVSDSDETVPSPFGWRIEEWVEDELVASKVVTIPAGTTPLVFGDLVDSVPTIPLQEKPELVLLEVGETVPPPGTAYNSVIFRKIA